MRTSRFAIALSLGLFAATAVQAEPIKIAFASLDDATVSISGDGTASTIAFVPGVSGDGFAVTNGIPTTVTAVGTINGDFSFLASEITPSDTVPLTSNGPATLTINDDTGGTLTAILDSSELSKDGSVFSINSGLALNASSITYTPGSTLVAEFQNLADVGKGAFVLSFDTNPNLPTLADMAASGYGLTVGSYSGSLTAAVPEPASLVMMALGAVPVLGLSLRRRRRNTA